MDGATGGGRSVVVINIVQEVDEGNDKFGTFERFNSNFGVN